jgi:hypothetical protein
MRRTLRWGAALSAILFAACRGEHQGPGEIKGKEVPPAVVAERDNQQLEVVEALVADASTRPSKQILFGDLHVHTTFSADAFVRSLPFLQGEGVHPPADACDFARFCSGLDFWSINDHAEVISPQHWKETKESIRQCNAVAGDAENPDVVAFLGWEWTQVGTTPENHYGHKNVVLVETAEDKVPKRPISALSPQLVGGLRRALPFWQRIQLPLFDFSNRQSYFDFGLYQEELNEVPACPAGVDSRQLPEDCHESAQTPQELFEKLGQLGVDSIVIPHGTTWGLYTPAGSTWDKQLTAAQNPEGQTLIEVFSGHGNSEEYREWRAVRFDEKGEAVCPAPTPNYLPCCWQAGEIIRSRCGDASAEECERRVEAARIHYLKAGVGGRRAVPGTTVEDWLDCGQCRDCFTPSFNYRPGSSAQYTLAITNFDDPQNPRRFRFGFIASSDNHSARPGTGYKEYKRRMMTEVAGARDEAWAERMLPPEEPKDESVPFDPFDTELQTFQVVDFERQSSFFMTGGLVAVHAEGRNRRSIWDALERREVYGTSGPHILLWFDLLNGPQGTMPMGSEVALSESPRFRVRAVGSLEQKPGCPEHSTAALSPERLEYLCRGECYNPSDERLLIKRIEVVRIRPQKRPGEPVVRLIEDPWRRYDCPPNPNGCEFEFSDPDLVPSDREAVYYVRALQEETEAVNGGGLRCQYNDKGECVKVDPCHGDYRTPYEEDCLWPLQERARSSPIYVKPS